MQTSSRSSREGGGGLNCQPGFYALARHHATEQWLGPFKMVGVHSIHSHTYGSTQQTTCMPLLTKLRKRQALATCQVISSIDAVTAHWPGHWPGQFQACGSVSLSVPA